MTLAVRDASNATVQIKTNDDLVAAAGAPNGNVLSVQGITGGWPLPTYSAGNFGTDRSANRPTLPASGAAFATSGPYAGYVRIAVAPANAARNGLSIENNSGAQIAVVLDDGTVADGIALVSASASVFALAGGSGIGSQGGSIKLTDDKGRVQIYAPTSTAQVMMRET